VWSQQDSATAHTTDNSLTALEGLFVDRRVSHFLWPACSPDFTLFNFYLWGKLKDKVYRTNPHSEEELKENMKRNFGSSSGRTSSGEFQPT
jgi:hypothetical protein